MILVSTNWTSGGRSGKRKLVKRKQGDSIEQKGSSNIEQCSIKKKQIQRTSHPRR
jgi:hypothetical protein